MKKTLLHDSSLKNQDLKGHIIVLNILVCTVPPHRSNLSDFRSEDPLQSGSGSAKMHTRIPRKTEGLPRFLRDFGVAPDYKAPVHEGGVLGP